MTAPLAHRKAAELPGYLQLIDEYRVARSFCLTYITGLEVPPSDILAFDMVAGQDFSKTGKSLQNSYAALGVFQSRQEKVILLPA